MHRIDHLAAPAADIPHHSPDIARVAALEALGMRAVIHLRAYHDGTVRADFVARGADGRLRCGDAYFAPPARCAVTYPHQPSFPYPDGPEELAVSLSDAAHAAERHAQLGVGHALADAFDLGGWNPVDRTGCSANAAGAGDQEPAFGWLATRTATDEALCEAWDATLAPALSPDDREALVPFVRIGKVDFPAFDACLSAGALGEARRAFARSNPLLANRVLADAALLAHVDAGSPLPRILDAASDAPVLPLMPAETPKAPKAGLAKLSGHPLPSSMDKLLRYQVVAAAEALPREWMPRSAEEADAFAYLCRAALLAFGRHSRVASWRGPWWRRALAGAGGRWVDYAARVAEAGGPGRLAPSSPSWSLARQLSFRIEEDTNGLLYFAQDLARPLALAYGARRLLALGSIQASRRLPFGGGHAFGTFACHALREGMDLPSLAAMARRHREARPAIRAVTQAHPSTAPRLDWMVETAGTEICRLPDGRAVRATEAYAGTVRLDNMVRYVDPERRPGHVAFEAADPRGCWTLGYVVDGGPAPPWHEIEAAVMERWSDPRALLDAATEGRGIPALGRHPIELGSQPTFDPSAPGALDVMLAAWRPVLPRRWRRLDAAGLAAALDAEAAAYVATA